MFFSLEDFFKTFDPRALLLKASGNKFGHFHTNLIFLCPNMELEIINQLKNLSFIHNIKILKNQSYLEKYLQFYY